jgi:aryl-phospho-beta-D-glucosidase BglC (GH1 family)
MVLNQFAVSTSEGGSCLRCVVISSFYISNVLLIDVIIAFTQPWITPSLFDNTSNPDVVDEWTFGQYQDHAVALETLTNHWNTWITETDFQAIAAAGCVVACLGTLQGVMCRSMF